MIKTLSLVLAFISLSFAPVMAQEAPSSAQSVVPEQSCHQDYAKRRKHLVIRALATPVIGVGVAALGIVIGANLGVEGNGGWDSLVYALIGGYIGVIATVVSELRTIYELIKANSLVKIIEEAHLMAGKRLEALKRYATRKLDREVTLNEVSNALTKADMSGILCDGSMRGKSPDSRLKKRLARRKEINAYLLRALR